MEIKPESEVECTLIDPAGPIAWIDDETLVGQFRGDISRFILARYVGNSEVAELVPRDHGRRHTEYLLESILDWARMHMSDEIVSPNGKKALVRRCVDGPTPTHLFVYDTAE